jgi:hypothetical protein
MAAMQALSGFVLTGAADDVRDTLESLTVKYNALLRRVRAESYELHAEDDEDSHDLATQLRRVSERIRDLEIERILSRLRDHGNEFPEDEIIEARRHQKFLIPLLLKECGEQIEKLRKLDSVGEPISTDPCSSVPFFSFFLFSEWNVADSVPVILEGLRLPGEAPFELFGDAVHEQTPRYLAQFLFEDLDRIDALVRDTNANPYVRWNSASSYKFLVRDQKISVDDAVVRLDRLFHETKVIGDDGRPGWGHCYELNAGILDVIESIGGLSRTTISLEDRDWNFVDESIICREDFDRLASSASDREATERLLDLPPTRVEDCLEELYSWAVFNPEPESSPKQSFPKQSFPEPSRSERPRSAVAPVRAEPLPPAIRTPIAKAVRVPRNAPCPCGSGKKYKQCCLRKADEILAT